MADLRQAAQAVLERWDSPPWKWSQQGPTAELMADLRAALEQPTVKESLTVAPDAQRFTEQQLRDYGSAEFERAVVLAMRATRPFGKTGDVIAVSIAHIKRSEA